MGNRKTAPTRTTGTKAKAPAGPKVKSNGKAATMVAGETHMVRELLAAVADLQWQTDAALRITAVSDGFSAVTGFTLADAGGRALADLGIAPVSSDEDAALATATADHEPVRGIVLAGIGPDERDVWLRASFMPVDDANGDFAGYHCAATDVSEFYQLQQELEDADLRLQALATSDPLTETFNRRRFEEQAEIELARVRRYGKPLSLIMLDGDHFKQINAEFGHDAGDTVLQAIADACRGALRQSDIVGRMDGEAFAILLPETSMDGAWETAERVRTRVAAHKVPHGDGMISFTVSLGVATSDANDWHLGRLMAAADRALYAAKAAGRNRVVTADTLGGFGGSRKQAQA
jgi:diguanylate cyclase (GGDEF)-like protein/PAS domain S-box-containing protein